MIRIQQRPYRPVHWLGRAAFVPWIVLCLAITSADAATLTVTTTDDIVAIDGQCSLREAVTAANTNTPFSDCPQGDPLPTVDLIELPVGTYSLTLEPIGEDANLGGDLDITEAVTLRGLGDDFFWWDDPATPNLEVLDVWGEPDAFPRDFAEVGRPEVVIENGLGKPAFPGDGDRVIHNFDPPRALSSRSSKSGAPPPVITLENLAVARGDDSCGPDIQFCDTVAAGILHEAAAALRLERVAIFANRSSCLGALCGSDDNASAVRMESAHDLEIIDSVLADNVATCADSQCTTGALIVTDHFAGASPRAVLRGNLVTGNHQTCSATDCRVTELAKFRVDELTLEQTAFIGNEIRCFAAGNECDTEALIELDTTSQCDDPACSLALLDLEIAENRLICEGFQCDTDPLLKSIGRAHGQSVHRVRLRNNEQQCNGVGCKVDEVIDMHAADQVGASFELDTIEVLDNLARCSGSSCSADGGMRSHGWGVGTLTDVTFRAEVICEGADCAAENIVDLEDFASMTHLEVIDSLGSCSGDRCTLGPLIRLAFGLDPGTTWVDALEVSGNQLVCDGTDCGYNATDPTALAAGGMIDLRQQAPHRTVLSRAVVSGNLTDVQGTLSVVGTVEIRDGLFTNNVAAEAGAIRNGVHTVGGPEPADLSLWCTTLEGNSVPGLGAGILNNAGSTLSLSATSIDNNMAGAAGGIWNEGSIILRQNTTIDGNSPDGCVDFDRGTGCDLIHSDKFESGDTTFWSPTDCRPGFQPASRS